MRLSKLGELSVALLIACLAVGLVDCGSDDPVVPEDACLGEAPDGFAYSNPEPGRLYIWAGNGSPGAGKMGRAPGYTSLYWPVEVDFDLDGNPIVLDWNNHRVLAVDANGKFEKLIGKYFGDPSTTQEPLPKLGTETPLNHPTHVAFAPDGRMFVSAWHNSVLLEMDMTTHIVNLYGGTGGRCFNGDGNDRLATCLDLPVCARFHPVNGDLYVCDQANQLIRRVKSDGTLETIAGSVPVWNGVSWDYQLGYTGDGGPATSAKFDLGRGQMANVSGGFCFDAAGNIYLADTNNNAVRIIHTDGTVETFAGMGPTQAGYSGDGGPASQARLRAPRDVTVDADGNVFIADTFNHVIRKVATDGTITTVVGSARKPDAIALSPCELANEQGAPATETHLTVPSGVEIDHDGNLWIADTNNQVVRIYYR